MKACLGRTRTLARRTFDHTVYEQEDKEGVVENRKLIPIYFSETRRQVVSNAGERSCLSDSKQRALAESKSVLISYLIFPKFYFLQTFYFSTACLNFQNLSCMLEFILALFCFYKNLKNISKHQNHLEKIFFEHLFGASLTQEPRHERT